MIVQQATKDLATSNLRNLVEISGWLTTDKFHANRIGAGKYDMYRSPYNPNDNTPSCIVYDTGFTDRSGGNKRSGNWFDLYKAVNGPDIPAIPNINVDSDYIRALYWIQVDILNQPHVEARRVKIEQRQKAHKPTYEADLDKIMKAHQYWEESSEYLYLRGLTADVIKAHKIGSMVMTWKIATSDTDTVDVTARAVSLPNIFRGQARDVELRVDDMSFQKAIENLPIETQIQIAKYNDLEVVGDYVPFDMYKEVMPSRFWMYGSTDHLWNTGVLFNADGTRRNLQQILITEGRFDALGLISAGYNTVQVRRNDMLGANLSEAFKNVSEIIVIEDNDDGAGASRTEWIKSCLPKKPIRVVVPKILKDTNDLIQAQVSDCRNQGDYEAIRYVWLDDLMKKNKVIKSLNLSN